MATFYKKVQTGKRVRYEAVREDVTYDSLQKGAHLLIVSPGLRTVRCNIEPAHADVLAAMEMHREDILRAVQPAFDIKPAQPMSPRHRAAFEAYKQATGDETLTILMPSANSLFDALMDAICKRT